MNESTNTSRNTNTSTTTNTITISLTGEEAAAIKKIAAEQGLTSQELLRGLAQALAGRDDSLMEWAENVPEGDPFVAFISSCGWFEDFMSRRRMAHDWELQGVQEEAQWQREAMREYYDDYLKHCKRWNEDPETYEQAEAEAVRIWEA